MDQAAFDTVIEAKLERVSRGEVVEFEPEEAEALGVFVETAMSDEDAEDGWYAGE